MFACDTDKHARQTYEANFRHISPTLFSSGNFATDITKVDTATIPDFDILCAGFPCQTFSIAGKQKGFDDPRGKLFFEIIRILKAKQPKAFLLENVRNLVSHNNGTTFKTMLQALKVVGYNVSYSILNAHDYGVPQDRKRVIIVGYHKEKVGFPFLFPEPVSTKPTLRDAIWDLRLSAKPPLPFNKSNGTALPIPNHEYMTGSFSPRYMARNRVRVWDEPSFTIQAGARHAPLHPQAPKMKLIQKDKREFVVGKGYLYRRLSVRECARIQTFPDSFVLRYSNIIDGYKMVGNAVPVDLVQQLAKQISADLGGLELPISN